MPGTPTPLAITLQRQGISASLRTQPHALMTPGPGNSSPGFSLVLQAVPSGTAWYLDLAIDGKHEKSFRQRMRRPILLVRQNVTGRGRSRSRTSKWPSALPKRNWAND